MPSSTEPNDATKPKRRHNNRRFVSPQGGDPGRSSNVSLYYNPSPAVLLKKQRIKQVATRLFAERGVAAVGLSSVGSAANLPNRGVNYYYRNREDLLADVLVEHVVALTERIGAAHDAHAEAEPEQRLHALVAAFHEAVLAAPEAHRAMLFNVALLPAKLQVSVRGRYRFVLEMFVETLGQAVPDLVPYDAACLVLPALERLISGVVLWSGAIGSADPARYAHLVTAMVLAAGRAVAAEPRAADDTAIAAPDPLEWLAPLRPDFAPRAAWRSYAANRDDVAAAGFGSSIEPGEGEAKWLPAREAQRRWHEILPAAGAGAEFVLTSFGWPIARLGPAIGETARVKSAHAMPDHAGT